MPAPLIAPYVYADFLDTNGTGYWADLPYIAGYGGTPSDDDFGFPLVWAKPNSSVYYDDGNWFDPGFGTGDYWLYIHRTSLLTGAPVGAANTAGDSGGPLLFKRADGRWFVVGVDSQGFPRAGSSTPSLWEYSRTLFSPTWANGESNHKWIGGFIKDLDGDGVHDDYDNCAPELCDSQIDCYNPQQTDTDGDGVGDTCDNCPTVANADQANVLDTDDIGDVCDPCPYSWTPQNAADEDGDGVGNTCDNCPGSSNPYDSCVDDSDCEGATCLLADSGQGHCSRQTDDPDEDGIGAACDACPTVPSADIAVNSNAIAEQRETFDDLPDICDPVPLLSARPILEEGLFSDIDPDAAGRNPGNTVYLRASAQVGLGGAGSTTSGQVGLRHCDCVVPGVGPLSKEQCVGDVNDFQCSWDPGEFNAQPEDSLWHRMTLAESSSPDAIGVLGEDLPRGTLLSRIFTTTRWLEDRFTYANTDEREPSRLGQRELLGWSFVKDLQRTGNPGALVRSYVVDGIEQTWGAVWTHVLPGTAWSQRDSASNQRLRDSYTYVHTPVIEISVPFTEPNPLNDCGLPNCSPWLDPWYLWPIDPDPFVNPFLRGKLEQPSILTNSGVSTILVRPAGTSLDVSQDIIGSGISDLLATAGVEFVGPVEDGITARRLNSSTQFVGVPNPWDPATGAVVEVRAYTTGLYPSIPETGGLGHELPPPRTTPVPGAPPLAAEESAPPPLPVIARPSYRAGAVPIVSASERALYLVGGIADRSETFGDVWQYGLEDGAWKRLQFTGAHMANVITASYDWTKKRILVVDEIGSKWLRQGRLLELDVASRKARVVGTWPRIGFYKDIRLVPRANGEIWVFGSSVLGLTHVFRTRIRRHAVVVKGFAALPGKMQGAPHNGPESVYVAIKRHGGTSIQEVSNATLQPSTQCWNSL